MSTESFLSSIIEVAIAIAGFAGIVAAIRHRDVTRWADGEQILLRMLLASSGTAVSFALLPAILFEVDLPEPAIWRAGSISLLLWLFAAAALRTRQLREIDSAPNFPQLVPVGVVCSALLQILNIYLEASWPYLIGIFIIVVNGFTFFLLLLFGSTSAAAQHDDEDRRGIAG